MEQHRHCGHCETVIQEGDDFAAFTDDPTRLTVDHVICPSCLDTGARAPGFRMTAGEQKGFKVTVREGAGAVGQGNALPVTRAGAIKRRAK